MKNMIEDFFRNLELGGIKCYQGLAAVPVFSPAETLTPHITLKEAFRTGEIEVREISQGGSVPELFVINNGIRNILMLDGEEFQGAKQNRVLNITVLLVAKARIVVPVSCTEKGRWHYTSSVFKDSGTLAAQSVRLSKNRSVGANLVKNRNFESDQSEIWNEIDDLSMRSKVRSSTGAMRDVFQDMEEELACYESSFPMQEGQKGVIFFRSGGVAGFEYISDSNAFRELYPRILRSYAVEAAAAGERGDETTIEQVRIFIEKAASAKYTAGDSAGKGEDIRFLGDGVIGSALAYHEEILHAVFFSDRVSRRSGREGCVF